MYCIWPKWKENPKKFYTEEIFSPRGEMWTFFINRRWKCFSLSYSFNGLFFHYVGLCWSRKYFIGQIGSFTDCIKVAGTSGSAVSKPRRSKHASRPFFHYPFFDYSPWYQFLSEVFRSLELHATKSLSTLNFEVENWKNLKGSVSNRIF